MQSREVTGCAWFPTDYPGVHTTGRGRILWLKMLASHGQLRRRLLKRLRCVLGSRLIAQRSSIGLALSCTSVLKWCRSQCRPQQYKRRVLRVSASVCPGCLTTFRSLARAAEKRACRKALPLSSCRTGANDVDSRKLAACAVEEAALRF
eukprot:6187908-Pleurochrysis_carterae.AAC.2